MRTIPELVELLKLLEDIIHFKFIASITGGHICSDNERKVLSLPARYGDVAILSFMKL